MIAAALEWNIRQALLPKIVQTVSKRNVVIGIRYIQNLSVLAIPDVLIEPRFRYSIS
jgi:hypothetical protein